jgi:predicted enzyme related to lactoylglutathione lyase
MSTICHFEIPVDDIQRAKKFYTELFEWKFQQFTDMNYWGIQTSEPGKGVNGGMMERQAPNQQILNYIDVDSVAKYLKKVETLGGKVLMVKTAVPEMGWFGICMDTENNVFGLWEDDKFAK